ncbi:MAG: hypothetical protein HY367_01265 [Candidatus Aenigmarchaeota archaeon]|nr:hypothetical protein [Candidatus Aenigmarchaeota archaeon]
MAGQGKTLPKPTGIGPETPTESLVAGRYGTGDMIEVWGPEKTYSYNLYAKGVAADVMGRLYPDVMPPEAAREIAEKASLKHIDPQRIRKLEAEKGHDNIAYNIALEEVVSPVAKPHIDKARTSADSTETAKALQIRRSYEVIADSVENLRDIVIEKGIGWIDTPHMDLSHLIDALPTVAGRPFMHYAELLDDSLELLKVFYKHSIVGKWADATGNHHSATAYGMDGMMLEDEYCRQLEVRHMIAPAQIPGREYISDTYYMLTRIGTTMANLANFIRFGRGSDAAIYKFPRGKKGSASMPHKDAAGGNPVVEEQTLSYDSFLAGTAVTGLVTALFDYARDLRGSASDRINLENSFKWGDFVTRRLAEVVYKLQLDEERSKERVARSYGVVTSSRLMAYLTDAARTSNPMGKKEAHDLAGRLASQAYDSRRWFADICLESPEIRERFDEEVIRAIADPFTYIGQSKEEMQRVAELYHGKKTFNLKTSSTL